MYWVLLSLAFSNAEFTAEKSSTWGSAKLEYRVPATWTKVPGYPEQVPHYAPALYKRTPENPLGLRDPAQRDGYLVIQRDNEDNSKWRSMWGHREFSMYLSRSAQAIPNSFGRTVEYDVVWEHMEGRDEHHQLVKVAYTGKDSIYWLRASRRIQVGSERFVLIVWKELSYNPGKPGEIERDPRLAGLREIVQTFKAESR